MLHMSFRLVPNSVTLDDLERCNSPNCCIISLNLVAFGSDYVILSLAEMYAKECNFQQNIIYGDIGMGSPLARVLM